MDTDLLSIVIPTVWCLAIFSSAIYCISSKTSILNRRLKSTEEDFNYIQNNMIDEQ